MSWWKSLAKWAAGQGLEWLGKKIERKPEKPIKRPKRNRA